jgi:hypothetical protein
MALIKEILIDQITVVEDGTVLVREVTRVIENGIELSKQYHRTSFAPDSDISTQPSNVQAVCIAVWTPEIILAYKEKQAKAIL